MPQQLHQLGIGEVGVRHSDAPDHADIGPVTAINVAQKLGQVPHEHILWRTSRCVHNVPPLQQRHVAVPEDAGVVLSDTHVPFDRRGDQPSLTQ